MNFLKWMCKLLFSAGLKLITKLIRFGAQAYGVPQSRLPTERDVVCTMGSTFVKNFIKSKAASACLAAREKLFAPIRWMLPGKEGSVTQMHPSEVGGLVIDI